MQEYLSAVRVLDAVINDGKSLDAQFKATDSPLSKQISYGVVRDYFHLSEIVRQVVKKPLAGKNAELHLLLLAGLYSVDNLNRPAHASVNAVVNAAHGLKLGWAKGLVNAVLRNYLRNQQTINASLGDNLEARLNHPDWLIQRIRSAWPAQFDAVIAANNARPPMTLRVNQQHMTTQAYLDLLTAIDIKAHTGTFADSALYLAAPANVALLPEFARGYASVQDEASQLVAALLAPLEGMRVLDACAAPGGKTCHLLESFPGIKLTALDFEAARLRVVEENLQRIGLQADCVAADLLTYAATQPYERILLDAPCSATGIIRRHPDIKLLRRNSDIDKLAATQLALLHAAWRLLAPGGILVYSTCSILPTENEQVLEKFFVAVPEAILMPIEASWGYPLTYGRQLLPDQQAHDGFYYARIAKAIAS